MIKAYIDNSVISELRKQGSQQQEKRELIFKICKEFGILAENCIITDKLFLELIYYGNIRKQIVKSCENDISAIQSKICRAVSKNNIKNGVDSLEYLFGQKLRSDLSASIIVNRALKSLQDNPFPDQFRIFGQKVIIYANDIAKDVRRYNQFISDLVIDSVARYALLEPAGRISHDTFMEVINFLLKKYRAETKNLLLIYVAAAKSKEEAFRRMKDKARLIRPRDDFADVEPQYFVFYGKETNGRYYPITFLTCEPIKKIQERMDYYFYAGILEIAKNSPTLNAPLLPGISLIIDFKNFECTEISSGSFLSQIPTSSYRVLG